MFTSAFIFYITCQITTNISEKSLNLFTISDLSLTIESESLKYLGKDLLVLFLEMISFIVFHVFFISNLKLLKHLS